MNKRAIEPFDIVTVRIHDHDLITEDGHRQQKDCTKRHCQGKCTQPKPVQNGIQHHEKSEKMKISQI